MRMKGAKFWKKRDWIRMISIFREYKRMKRKGVADGYQV